MKERREKKEWLAVFVTACFVMLALVTARLVGLLTTAGDARGDSAALEWAEDDGVLGFVLIDIGDADTASFYHVPSLGVYVLAVDEGSVAYRAGVRSGDRVISANGIEISASSELNEIWAALPADGELTLTLFRTEQQRALTVSLSAPSETLA